MSNLFETSSQSLAELNNDKIKNTGGNIKLSKNEYTANDIQVLEGLEPVRLRPGMYIGGTDINGLHHLMAEILDNSMDEVVAGHASRIDVNLLADNVVVIEDDGRGIPIDNHVKYSDKSALEVIFTTLHSGGKFKEGAYQTSGGLHGVGVSVVNALSEYVQVEVCRNNILYRQNFSYGEPVSALQQIGKTTKRSGTKIVFKPDSKVFKDLKFDSKKAFLFCRSKAYLYKGVKIYWNCDNVILSSLEERDSVPKKKTLFFPSGLRDYLQDELVNREVISKIFVGESQFNDDMGKVEWAVGWSDYDTGFLRSFCNAIPTSLGGTHEVGFKAGLLKSIRSYCDIIGNKMINKVIGDDIVINACAVISIFIKDAQFQGQTKERLGTAQASRLVENAIKDAFDQWLVSDRENSDLLIKSLIENAEARLRKKEQRQVKRQSVTKRLRLPGKLSDCSVNGAYGTELFLVEGDSAGGTAKQARDRKTQAILPLRGKILNVASASKDKIKTSQEIQNIIEALGCGVKSNYSGKNLRYEKVIIMTDADVDGAHIASLLITFFYKQMPDLIKDGKLYLAMPPLYRLNAGSYSVYALDDAHKDELMNKKPLKGKKVSVSRFKGLGEMPSHQLRETTMDKSKRKLLRLTLAEPRRLNSKHDDNDDDIYDIVEVKENYNIQQNGVDDSSVVKSDSDVVENGAIVLHDSPEIQSEVEYIDDNQIIVEHLMGKKSEHRMNFIQKNARFVDDIYE